MAENINDTEQPNSIDIAANPRSKLIYDYTEKLYKAKSDNIDVLNTRLGLLLGASATLLKFAFDLHKETDLCIDGWYCYSCVALKLLSIAFIGQSIYLCLEGLKSSATGRIVLPSALMEDELYESAEEIIRAKIINTWIPTINEFDKSLIKKSSLIRQVITSLVYALLFFSIDSLVIMFK